MKLTLATFGVIAILYSALSSPLLFGVIGIGLLVYIVKLMKEG